MKDQITIRSDFEITFGNFRDRFHVMFCAILNRPIILRQEKVDIEEDDIREAIIKALDKRTKK